MFLGLLTLLTALTISSVAVYYSVSGLAAIFAGASIPIIIMGASLEIGKLVTASWLHANWKRAPFVLKSYLMIATVILMFITSMGIFGFLSRAHIEQGAPVGDVAAQVELLDEKISAKRTEIEQAKTATKNLDEVVSQYLLKGKDEKSVAAANNARKNQQKERDRLAKQITDAQKDISKLQEEKLPLTKEVRKIETEVGPIKYIAQFMYNNNAPNKDILEKAVTWMILIIIFVFDPLAVLLLIASQISFEQWRERRAAKRIVKEDTAAPVVTQVIVPVDPIVTEPVVTPVIIPVEPIKEETRTYDEKLSDVLTRLDEKAKDFKESVVEPAAEPEPIVTVVPEVIVPEKPKRVKRIKIDVPAPEPVATVTEIEDVKKKNKYMMKKNQQQLVLPKK